MHVYYFVIQNFVQLMHATYTSAFCSTISVKFCKNISVLVNVTHPKLYGSVSFIKNNKFIIVLPKFFTIGWCSQLPYLTFSIKEWCEDQAASSLVVSLGKALNGIASTFEWLNW